MSVSLVWCFGLLASSDCLASDSDTGRGCSGSDNQRPIPEGPLPGGRERPRSDERDQDQGHEAPAQEIPGRDHAAAVAA